MQSAFSAVSLLRLPLFGSLLGDHSALWLSRPKHEGGVTSIAGLNSLRAFVLYPESRTLGDGAFKSVLAQEVVLDL
ncbi:hypothetical protein BDR22DRAFT_854196, partial [Usnea florida]